MKPRENWDPKLVWVLRSFLEQQEKWDTPKSNPKRNGWFTYWSPRFYVVHNDVLIETDTGVYGWQDTIVPLLKKIVGV